MCAPVLDVLATPRLIVMRIRSRQAPPPARAPERRRARQAHACTAVPGVPQVRARSPHSPPALRAFELELQPS